MPAPSRRQFLVGVGAAVVVAGCTNGSDGTPAVGNGGAGRTPFRGEHQPALMAAPAAGGTYQAIRVIRLMAGFWDRTRLNEQEAIFHRRRGSGAPLGKIKEIDTPEIFDEESLASHIGRANLRTSGSASHYMLRRGAFNYTNGLDGNNQLDQGLVFVSYQPSIEDGFIAVQRRLDGEALEEYVRPIGGGFFFTLPSPEPGGRLAAGLLS